jgi:hypothetical protein
MERAIPSGNRAFAVPVFAVIVGLAYLPHPATAGSSSSTQGSTAKKSASASFLVVSDHRRVTAGEVAELAEQIRQELQQRWFPCSTERGPWNPRCEIVVHASEGDYLRQVGVHAALTRGVCRIDYRQGRIARRRIDLWPDPATDQLTALAHEITHVVLADHFPTGRLPRWADEGIALLADRPQKQDLHRSTLIRAIQDGRCPGLPGLLARRTYPAGSQLGVFYGQSLSLVELLVELDEPSRLIDFLQLAQRVGYDTAVRKVYNLEGTTALESLWREHLQQAE